jgi:hypothetical protein
MIIKKDGYSLIYPKPTRLLYDVDLIIWPLIMSPLSHQCVEIVDNALDNIPYEDDFAAETYTGNLQIAYYLRECL